MQRLWSLGALLCNAVHCAVKVPRNSADKTVYTREEWAVGSGQWEYRSCSVCSAGSIVVQCRLKMVPCGRRNYPPGTHHNSLKARALCYFACLCNCWSATFRAMCCSCVGAWKPAYICNHLFSLNTLSIYMLSHPAAYLLIYNLLIRLTKGETKAQIVACIHAPFSSPFCRRRFVSFGVALPICGRIRARAAPGWDPCMWEG